VISVICRVDHVNGHNGIGYRIYKPARRVNKPANCKVCSVKKLLKYLTAGILICDQRGILADL
jgi:hypothetical protein